MANERTNEHGSGAEAANLVAALAVHVFLGLPWLAVVVGISWLFDGAWLWGLCGGGLWVLGAVDAIRRRRALGRVWGAIFRSWLWLVGGPVSVAVVAIQRFGGRKPAPAVPVVEPVAEEPVNPALARRLDEVERRLRELGQEVREIRRLAESADAPLPAATVERPPEPRPAPPPAPLPPPVQAPPREPSFWQREIDWGELLGAKALAWVGGAVTVLGVVFFFVLAVDRGWIGPGERVGLGALASALVFCGGLYLHRRFGPSYSASAAVGAGLAGGYATLLAAAALYDLVSDLGALAIAAVIASVGLVTALAWSSELVAGIGLVGAALVPLMVLFEDDISALGTGFAAVVFAAIAVVSVSKRWTILAACGLGATLPQIALLLEDGVAGDWDRVLVAWAFSALYVGAAVGLHRAVDRDGLGSLPATFVIVAGVLAGATGFALFDGADRGWAVVAAGVAFGVLAAALFRDRDVSALHAAVALGLIGVGLAVVLSGPSLALAWAAEAAVLAALAHRISEPRYQLAALLYLAAAAVHALAIDAPPMDLYEAVADPADGAIAPLGVGIAAAVVAWFARPWPESQPAGLFRLLEPVMAPLRERADEVRTVTGWVAGAGVLYASSLAILGLAQAWSSLPVEAAFERGHVGVTALWGLAACSLTYASRWLGSFQVRAAGLTLAAATSLQAAIFDVTLEPGPRGWALLVAATALLLTALAEEIPAVEGVPEISPSAVLLVPGSAAMGVAGLYFVTDAEGWAWLGLAAVYSVLAALVFRSDRDFSTALWIPALAIGALAAAELLDGTWLVLAWSIAAAVVSLIGDRLGEERLQLGAAGYLVLALGYTLTELAPPREFLSANDDPAVGVPALLACLGAGLALVVFGMRDERVAELRRYAVAGSAVLALYTISLVVLGAFEWAGTANVDTDFQRGHSAVSAIWGIVGLITLYVGLRRDVRALRLAGFALFGVSLAKLFLYDLAFLSSVTRALSFLAVGALLLLAGFFYQRLAAATRESVG